MELRTQKRRRTPDATAELPERLDAFGRGAGWVWPGWMAAQYDPLSAAYVAGERRNVTRRDWTGVGTVASAWRARVDPWGLVTPRPGGWSLDWWIGAEDRWHVPSRDRAVRQRLVDGAPVVETSMRIPGGDAVARAYGAIAPGGLGDVVIVEIENASGAPVVVALAVRPYHPEGLAWVDRVALEGDTILTVDGRPGVLLPRRPAGAVGSTFDNGDVAARVFANDTPFAMASGACRVGLAQAAVVFPLIHGSTLRVALPLAPEPRRAALPRSLPAAPAVGRAWEAHAGRGVRVTLPAGKIASAWHAARTRVLQAFDGSGVAGPVVEAVGVISSLGRLGFTAEVARSLDALCERQGTDGLFDGDAAATAAAMWALAEHARVTGGPLDHARITLAAGALAREAPDRAWAAAALAAVGMPPPERVRPLGPDEWWALALGAGDEATLGAVGAALVSTVGLHGLSPAATAWVAAREVAAGDPRGLVRLTWLLDVASPTFCWPDAVHPHLGTGCDGDGDSARSSAAVSRLISELLVRDEGDTIAVCSLLPPEWEGQEIEVHGAPTGLGRMSFAVRWHGTRPALLWELEPHPGVDRMVLLAPGLDAGWKGEGLRGEALLRT